MSDNKIVVYPPFEADENGNPVFSLVGQQKDGSIQTASTGREGEEMLVCSHNFCDRTTWYSTSARVTGEVLTDSGDGLTFTGVNQSWIDLEHGKLLWEDHITGDYRLSVTVDGAPVTEDPMYGPTPGDYTVDYDAGSLTFHTSQAGKSVVASYSYATTSEWILQPPAGKVSVVEDAEIQFSSNLSFDDCLRLAPWGYAGVFAPEMVPPLGAQDLIELTPNVKRYKRHDQILDEARGAYPTIGTVAGVGGSVSERFGYPLIYKTVTELHSAYGMELRVSLENNIPMGGERATVTFYGTYRTES